MDWWQNLLRLRVTMVWTGVVSSSNVSITRISAVRYRVKVESVELATTLLPFPSSDVKLVQYVLSLGNFEMKSSKASSRRVASAKRSSQHNDSETGCQQLGTRSAMGSVHSAITSFTLSALHNIFNKEVVHRSIPSMTLDDHCNQYSVDNSRKVQTANHKGLKA